MMDSIVAFSPVSLLLLHKPIVVSLNQPPQTPRMKACKKRKKCSLFIRCRVVSLFFIIMPNLLPILAAAPSFILPTSSDPRSLTLRTKIPPQLIILPFVRKRPPTHLQHLFKAYPSFGSVLSESLHGCRLNLVFDFLPAACEGGDCCL